MKLNQKEIMIQQCICETIEADTILYQEAEKKVLIINNTAASIWRAITAAAEANRDITSEEIAHMLCKQYSLGEERFLDICSDVDSTINTFLDAVFIKYKNE